MENLRSFMSRFGSQFREFWSKMSGLKKGIAVGSIALLGLGVFALFSTRQTDTYEYVFTGLSPEDTQAITSYMKQHNVHDFLVDDKGVRVPSKDVLTLRLKLSQEGLPTHGVVGWEKFDSQEFTRTEFEQRINKLRAIQGELQRTIQSIDGVISAKVAITQPRKSLFIEDEVKPTAAVTLRTKPNVTFDKAQIKGIVTLVSASVEGLPANNVKIVGNDGKLLTEEESEDVSVKMTKEMMAYKSEVEKKYERKIREMVARIVGAERVEVKVDAQVDFTQESQTISESDPDKAVLKSKETSGYDLSGTGLNPTGIPGAKSNVPGEQEDIVLNQSQTKNRKDSEVVNFELSKKISQKTMPVGKIIRLTAAVLVDGKQDYPLDGTRPNFEPRTEAELKSIQELVQSSVGFEQKRGDEITVRNVMFQLDPQQQQSIKEEKKETREYITTLTVSGAIALALVLFFGFIVRPYFRWLAYDPLRKQEQQMVEEFKPDLELGALQNVQVKEDVPFEKLTPQEQVIFLAKNEPKRTTEAIRLLLNPHHTAG